MIELMKRRASIESFASAEARQDHAEQKKRECCHMRWLRRRSPIKHGPKRLESYNNLRLLLAGPRALPTSS